MSHNILCAIKKDMKVFNEYILYVSTKGDHKVLFILI